MIFFATIFEILVRHGVALQNFARMGVPLCGDRPGAPWVCLRIPGTFGSRLWAIVLTVVAIANPMSAEPQRVLLINSFGREFSPYDAFAGHFRSELVRQSARPVDVYEVFLESARFSSDPQEGPIVDYLKAVFAGRRLDLIVPIGGPAVRFAQRYREQLFREKPMLLTAVDERHLQSTALTTNDAVVAVRFDLVRAIDNILRLLPETTNIVVVVGNSPLEQFWLDEMRREFQPLTHKVSFVWFNELSLADMLKCCAALPPRSAIFYAMLAVDAGGVAHPQESALADLRAVATSPIFGIQDTQLGRGIVGGPLMEIEKLSRSSVRVATRLLDGEPPGNITTPVQEPGVPVFDWQELQHWGIRESRLPPDSQIAFREPTVWGRYKWRVLAITAVCVVEGMLILVLLRSLRIRRRAEESLEESRNRLRAILDTAVEGIITIDERGTIESVNAAAETTFGYAAEEMIGRNVSLLMPEPVHGGCDPYLANDQRTRPPMTIGVGCEVSGRRKDGTVFPLDLAVSEVALPGRRVFTGFVRDITARKQAEQAEREFGGRLLQAQEAERARLARELHDDITQRLAMLAIDAGRVDSGPDGVGRSRTMQDIRNGLARLSEDVHSLSYRLHPSLLEDLGLADALKAECERLSRQESISIRAQLGEIPAEIPPDTGICLFRVTQEALRNVVRHAHARTVDISLRTLDGGLQLAVTDAGIGFDPGQQRQRPSLGLASMRERVRLLGGELDIESEPGHGTTILAWVPLNRG